MRIKLPVLALVGLMLATVTVSSAQTTELEPNVYLIESGVAFELGTFGASDFLFSWTDSSGTFDDIADPTLILVAGETFTFTRTSSSHPFRITDSTLPVTGTDGSFGRTTTDGAAIDAASLQPIGDFTADPAPTSDSITWSPGAAEIGDYYYTCRVEGHTGMTGALSVAPKPGSLFDTLLARNERRGDFDTLIAAALRVGLADALVGDDELTLFAPTDKAFRRQGLNPGNVGERSAKELSQILLYHVTLGKRSVADLIEDAPTDIEMLNGQTAEIRRKGRRAFINKSKITARDIEADNGVMHVIKKALRPDLEDVENTDDEQDEEDDESDDGEDDADGDLY